MTRPHLRRSLVVVAASALFAVTASGSALAWSGTVRQVPLASPAPAVPGTAAPTAVTQRAPVAQAVAVAGSTRASAHVAARRSTVRTASAPASSASTTSRAKPRAATKTAAAAGTVTISSYVDAPGSQAQIDKCHLVLWTHSPLWLAGHNWCGYQWLAFVRTGTTVVVTQGAAAGHYVVTGHLTLHRQSGSLPSLSADLVLQTCVGSSTGLTLLHRV